MLHRFIGHMGALAINPGAPVPPASDNPWVASVLEPRWAATPAAESALANTSQLFPMSPAASTAVRRLSPQICLADHL